MSEISSRVNDLMKANDVTGRRLAKVLGLSPSTVSLKLHSKVSWTTSDLLALSCFFGVSVDELVGLSNHESTVSGGGVML